jgi:Tat protein translocase TatB subunit
MFGIGIQELVVILIVALIVLGPDKLPEVARTIGKALGELRKATSGITDELRDMTNVFEDDKRPGRQPARPRPPQAPTVAVGSNPEPAAPPSSDDAAPAASEDSAPPRDVGRPE